MRRYSIWDDMRRMQEEMDRMFRGFLGGEPENMMLAGPDTEVSAGYRQPVCDICETDKDYIATVELPGVDKKDIQVDATDDGLSVKVEKKDEQKEEDKKKGYYSYRRSYSGFYRHFPLPENADADKVDASFKNGVLELKIPKKQVEEKKRKLIEVK